MSRTAALACALLIASAPAAWAQTHPAAPEAQAPVPEIGAARGAAPGDAPPAEPPVPPAGEPPMSRASGPHTAEPGVARPLLIDQPDPTGPIAVAPPDGPRPALLPLGDRGQPSAAAEEAARARDGGRIAGLVTIPDARAANLVQPHGQAWRVQHSIWLPWAGGAVIGTTLAALALFFLWRGRIRFRGGRSGRTVLRFGALERANHWMVAGSFTVLALSGLNLTFGRWVLLPVIGPEAFSALTAAGKFAHNFLAFPFMLGLLAMVTFWARDNVPNRMDLDWLREGGGIIGDRHPAAGRFNAGQKGVYWLSLGLGAAVAASGLLLIFPFEVTDILGQQWAQVAHAVAAMLMIATILGHAYIGTLGMEGAAGAMLTGRVDANWAREHHRAWFEAQTAALERAADR